MKSKASSNRERSKDKTMFRWLVIGLLVALSLSMEDTQNSHKAGFARSLCCNISSGNTSFTTFLAIGSHQVRELFEEASHCGNSAVPGDLEETEEDDQKKKRDVSADQFHDGVCVELKHGQSMAYCVGHVKSQYRYICEHAGTAITYNPTYSQEGHREDSSDKQCICIGPICKRKRAVDEVEYELKWRNCNCNKNDAFVCRTEVAAADDRLTSPPAGLVLPILLLFVAVAFIAVAVIFIIRKRKYARRHEVSPLKTTAQNDAVPLGYDTMVPDNRPSGVIVPIYTDLEMTQQPTPSSNTTYASIQPTSEVVDMGKSVDYTGIDFPLKDQQKPKSADKGTVSVSPIYSQPFEPSTSDGNTDYVEPYKPITAPVQSHQAAVDQQNIYSLAKAIPMADPNAIYSEPNKPTKSSTPTGKADPIHLEVIEAKQGAGIGGDAAPIKLKNSS